MDDLERLLVEKLGLENTLLDFQKVTGYEINKFIELIEYGVIEINTKAKKHNFKCGRCNTEYFVKLELEKILGIAGNVNPLEPYKYNHFYCVKCAQLIRFNQKILGIEAKLNEK